MIDRKYLDVVEQRLTQFSSVALLGPQQVGKTTLAKTVEERCGASALYLDLERAPDRRQLDDPDAFFDAHTDRFIVLDQIQRMPEIFAALRGAIDQRRQIGEAGGKFLFLGSASMDLLRQYSESLDGRITYIDLPPLQSDEIADSGGIVMRSGFVVPSPRVISQTPTRKACNGDLTLSAPIWSATCRSSACKWE